MKRLRYQYLRFRSIQFWQAPSPSNFAIFQAISGLAIGAIHHLAADLPYVVPVLQGIHIVSALAILAQASSVATAYDMCEEKEFQE